MVVEKKYRLVVQVDGKIFKDTRLYEWPLRRYVEGEARRLNQLFGVTAYIEPVVLEPGP